MSKPKKRPNADQLVKTIADELKRDEQAVEEAQARLKDIENRTKSAELKAIQAENRLHEVEENIKGAEQSYRAKVASIEALESSYKDKQQKLREDYDTLLASIADLKAQKNLLTKDIKERTDYQKEQEDKINEVVESGSDQITALNYELKQLEKQKVDSEIYKSDLEHQINELASQANTRRSQLEELNSKYEQVNNTYQRTLNGLRSRITEAQAEYELRVKEGKDIVEKLLAKEKVLETREAILADREYKVSLDERQWNSRKTLYKAG